MNSWWTDLFDQALYRTRWQFDDLCSIVKGLTGPHSVADGSDRWLGALAPLVDTILGATGADGT